MNKLCTIVLFWVWCFVIFAIFFVAVSTSYSEDPPIKAPEEVKNVEQEEKPTSSVVLIINDKDLTKCLVVSVDGRWVHDARDIEIKTPIGSSSKKPQLKCTIWRGLFKPTNPETKIWDLESIIMADDAQFQTTLDGLNKGEFSTQKPQVVPTK